ncbi:FtsK/SpoIIIE domain-containing protein [Brevibacterium marinum]|uniref:FtsK domain-containing protein n=1 Tax=Brevibacterium marinum TaxID=418643 RepID=A0A846RSD5_9MICO|nr:FtsK/SpoIIIE domain-containing protein [Brevibacterium marinum]NJC56669.1 hypothetical protein [Brevibacterium marinum]
MKTLGLVHRIDANANIRTDVLEADSQQLVLDVFRTVFGPVLASADLITGNLLPGESTAPEDIGSCDDAIRAVRTATWGRWQALNPVTLLGASSLHRGSGTATVCVLAGPDCGFTIGIDPRAPLLSRVSRPESVAIVDPCMSRRSTPLELGPAREQTFASLGTTVFSPTAPTLPWSRNAHVHHEAASTPAFGGRAPAHPRRGPTHVAPAPVDDPRPAKPPQWWAFLIPIAIGGVLALVTGMWWFLLFSATAPISGYVSFAMEKRRFARESAQCAIDRRHAIETAHEQVTTLIVEHEHLLQTAPGLCLGFGPVLSPITIAEVLQNDIDHLDGAVVVEDVPIRIDPRTTSVTVTGDHEQLRRMALSWLADPSYDWGPSHELLSLPELQGSRFDHEFAPPGAAAGDSRIVLSLSDQDSTATLRLEAPADTAAISLSLGSLAQARTADSSAAGGPVPGRSLIAALMPPGRFLSLERRQVSRAGVERLPNHGLGDLYQDTPQAIRHRWERDAPQPATIGRGADGDVSIDLFGDGPHALVAGTTGSGKSILLQTWLLAMALEHPPRRLRFVLIDFKGGATFAPLEDLPHTDSVLDDFDSATAFRALVSVRAEITRRERLLADHGCSDVLELEDPPPRLVVVIDEFHALMATHPKAADLLEHLTAMGRSLGVHLILATQRPLGVVTAHMKANINIRVCLRVRDDADSFDVIGVSDAAQLPLDSPGAACLDSGTSIVSFRVAVPTADPSAAETIHRPRLRRWDPGQGLPTQRGINGIRVANLEAAAREADDRAKTPSPPIRPVVLPPLPGPDEIGAPSTSHSTDGGRAVTGIVDIPNHQSQSEWSYSPAVDGSAVVVGTDPTVIAPVLERMAVSAARTHRVVALGRIATVLDWAEIGCGMDTGWRFHATLDHLTRGSDTEDRPDTIVVCSNWNEFIDSMDHHAAGEAERLLKHASGLGLTFLLAGCRSTTNPGTAFSTQVIFPPSAGGDGLTVGLSRQRFVGTWPTYRAVLISPSAHEAGGDGADVQMIPHRPCPNGAAGEDARRCGFEPRWHGLGESSLSALPGAPQREPRSRSIALGLDAFGGLVGWDPARDGPVLTVRGSPQSGKTDISVMLRQMCSAASSGTCRELAVHDDAHLEEPPESFDLLDGGTHVVTMPVRFTPGYGSPLAKAQGLGPMLILGSHGRQDLSNLGLLRLPPLDGEPGTAWFVTEQRAQAVRLFPAEYFPAFVGKRSPAAFESPLEPRLSANPQEAP